MDSERKFDLITRNLDEVLVADEVKAYIEQGIPLNHYIGFEISGKIHIGTGFMSMFKVKDLLDAGVNCRVFLADWHTWINDKLGGDMPTIQKVAVGYYKEAFKAVLKAIGGDPEKLKFVLGSELYHNNDEYWQTMIDVSKHTSLSRIKRSISILGRKEGEDVDFAKLIYPPMQVADIFAQKLTIMHAGMEQRKAHVIARDVALGINSNKVLNQKGEKLKPIALHQHIILGLQKPPIWPVPKEQLQDMRAAMKMSKSKPNSAIFVTDTVEEIRKKINLAFCPAGDVEYNPLLDWAKHVFFREKNEFAIERPEKFGGDITYESFEAMKKDFAAKKLSAVDLKNSMSDKMVSLLAPVTKHFESGAPRKMADELDELITGLKNLR